MEERAAGASAFGWMVATGPERGAALVLLCTGVGLLTVAIAIGTSRRLRSLDAPRPIAPSEGEHVTALVRAD
jgi:hypothetical protein